MYYKIDEPVFQPQFGDHEIISNRLDEHDSDLDEYRIESPPGDSKKSSGRGIRAEPMIWN